MPQNPEAMTIRMRPLIRYLGGFTGFIALSPSALGVGFFLLNPAEALRDPISALFCLSLASILGWATFRWLTIRGEANLQRIYLRGFLKTVDAPLDHLAKIRRTRFERGSWSNGVHHTQVIWRYVLHDHDDKVVGIVPSSLEACAGWQSFYERLGELINNRRVPSAAEAARD